MRANIASVFALAALTSLLACGGDEGPTGPDFTGSWQGSWVADDAELQGPLLVTIEHRRVSVAQCQEMLPDCDPEACDGDCDVIEGIAVLQNVPCFSEVSLEGQIINDLYQFNARLFDQNDDEKLITLTGQFFVDTDSLESEYFNDNWGICTSGFGTLQATRQQ